MGADAGNGIRQIKGSISTEATALLTTRIDELRAGIIKLNRQDDGARYLKECGIKEYALTEPGPLIRRLLLP